MSNSIDVICFGRRKIAASLGSSPTREKLTKIRVRILQEVFNNRKLVYRNRVAANRRNFLLSTIENEHRREQVTQQTQKHEILTDLKQDDFLVSDCLDLIPSYGSKQLYDLGIRIQSAGPHVRLSASGNDSNSIPFHGNSNGSRTKSASGIPRPCTASTRSTRFQDSEVANDVTSVSMSHLSSSKISYDQMISGSCATDCSQDSRHSPIHNSHIVPSTVLCGSHRITWPIRLKVFSLEDEHEVRQQAAAWRAERRKSKDAESLKLGLDTKLQQQYDETLRRRKEIESFATPDAIQQHQANDPIFAKRYRQLKSAIRAGKTPNYDPNDCEINTLMTKSKMKRARTAIITAEKCQTKTLFQNQQIINNAYLSKRVEAFLKRLSKFNEELKFEHG